LKFNELNEMLYEVYRHQFPVKLGSVSVTVNFQGLLKKIDWNWNPGVSAQLTLAPPVVSWLTQSLQEYFSAGVPCGEIPWELIDESEWTPFQKQVYRAIACIPHGETRTYGWVAQRLGNAAAGRAVGQALRANPLPILIPCHRVIAVTSLGGFMGTIDPHCSELKLKQRLIALEEEYINPLFNFLTPSREMFGPIAPPETEALQAPILVCTEPAAEAFAEAALA
jgi:methylated-DNA-[protein]-cysteine S-methyltransferase